MRLRFGRILIVLIVIFIVGSAVSFFGLPIWRMHDLRAACISGDRIVVDTNPFPSEMRAAGHMPITPAYDISGGSKVAALLDAIELNASILPASCKCFGDMKVTIYRGNTELAHLSIQHENALRWWNGRWSGDQPLSQSSRNALSTFLVANGCPTPSESRLIYVKALEAMPATP